MPAEDLHGRAVGVDRLQPGDHAFFAYSDDETRWDILAVFTQQGFARDEKVGLLVDVGHSPGWVAERVAGGAAAARRALRDGRLTVSNAPRFERGEFDAARLVEGARRRLDTVLAEGYTGLRSASEMSLALAPIEHLGQAVEYEIALHASLFSGQSTRYTALCYWDERLFGGTDAMKEARSVHPVIVLDRPGALHATVSGNRVSITGESDLASRTEFDEALRSLAGLPVPRWCSTSPTCPSSTRTAPAPWCGSRRGLPRRGGSRCTAEARSGGCCTCSAAGRSGSCRSSRRGSSRGRR